MAAVAVIALIAFIVLGVVPAHGAATTAAVVGQWCFDERIRRVGRLRVSISGRSTCSPAYIRVARSR